ncbi:MAG: HAMP domain-containing protein [Deltaproteobacteria bacterium]|nr:MAG: HAMP domain-containing protein [Deltaproteobacteria bacterium]
MGIRTQILLSYLVLILLLSLGMWFVDDWIMDKMAASNLTFAEEGVEALTTANNRLAEEILTTYGKYIVEDKAADVATELSYLLKGKKTYDYENLRRNQHLRQVAIQEIRTPEGIAGYTIVYDKNAVNLFHPDKKVEGINYMLWRDQYPEMWQLLNLSLKEGNVSGYLTFFDQEKRQRQRYAAIRPVPGTPFLVAAVVNIDEFFLPTQEKIRKASREFVAQAKQSIVKHHDEMGRTAKVAGLAAGTLVILLASLFGFYLAGSISRPLRRLQKGVREVGEGNFAVAVPEKGVREVVNLAHSFNQLGQQLMDYIAKRDFIRDTFGRYVTQEVVKKLLESDGALELGGETREVSILISDLRGFTALTADMEPVEVVTFLNRYLGKMIEILTDAHAVIDEIIGDGILAFFGAPEPMEDHPVRAVACALAMQAAMEEVNAWNRANGLPHLEMGIAVNTGEVVVGNIGSERRTKYSVVGAHVNFASRIESYAVGGQVLLGPATFQRVKDFIEMGETMEVKLKGVPGKTTLYEVTGMGEPYNIHLPERFETLTPLAEKIPVHLQRISEKIVISEAAAWIGQLCETSALLTFEGELWEWEDVRLLLLDAQGREIPERLYGKVTAVKPAGENRVEAHIRFTSVSPEIYPIFRRVLGLE